MFESESMNFVRQNFMDGKEGRNRLETFDPWTIKGLSETQSLSLADFRHLRREKTPKRYTILIFPRKGISRFQRLERRLSIS